MFKTKTAFGIAIIVAAALVMIFSSNADAASFSLQFPTAGDLKSAGPVIPSLVYDDIAREVAGLRHAVWSLGVKAQIVLALAAPVAIVWVLDGLLALIFGSKRDRDLAHTNGNRFSKPVHTLRLE